MKIHLAGISGVKKQLLSGELNVESIFALESFYSLQEWQKPLLNRFASFLLDSGAFTFMQAAAKHGDVDWLSYADRYADFVREYGIKQYFELDIDSLKGLKYAEMLRNRIETRVGWQSIPVWHTERGKDFEWHKERVAENALRHPYSFAIRIRSRFLFVFPKPLPPGRSAAPCPACTAHNARQRRCLTARPKRIRP